MRRLRGFTRAPETSGEINISPLIDMVFILLIFFIVTTVFVEETGVQVDKPRAASAANLDRNSILFAITAGNQVFYGGNDIGVKGVRTVVRRQLALEEMPVIIQADRAATVSLLTQVIDEAKLAGARSVNLAAKQE
ncbi:MAG TPA: biopolymer transporter ExbD [Verrucomicrobiales bacterium]|nr:biopolymer transporter ExbD [Verrucomicrobiales bacterium]